jgi:hypothetical protein
MSLRSALWLELWAAPIVWFLSLCASFAVAPWACGWNWQPALVLISLIALLITAAFGLKAWNHWHSVGRETPGELGGEIAACRLMASGAVLLNSMFFLVILAQLIVTVTLGACA